MTHSWTSSGKFSRLLSHTELRPVFPRKRTSGSGTFSKCNSRILTSASSAISGFCGLPVPSFFMASGTRHILEGYEPPRARAFDCREVYAELLRFTPGGVRGLRLIASGSASGILGLLGSTSGSVLSLVRYLPGLVGGLPSGLLDLSRCLLSRVLYALRGLPDLLGDPTERTSALLLAACEPAYGILNAPDGLPGLIGCLTGCVLGLLGGSASGVLGLACYLPGLLGDLSGRVLRSLHGLASRLFTAGPVFHRLGRFHHVADDDTAVAARALDLRQVYAPLPCLAAGRVRGLDLALAPDLIRVQVGDVLLRFVDALLHGRVVVHQLLKKCLEGFLSATRDLVGQALQRGTILTYVLFEHFGRITKIGLCQVHRPLLDISPGLLDALV